MDTSLKSRGEKMDSGTLQKQVMEKITHMTPPIDAGVIAGTTPVVSFGDFTTARIATLGINPSSKEFMSGEKFIQGESKRLADDEHGKANAVDIWFGCQNYFRGANAYWPWFGALEELLKGVGASYKDGSACHLDLSPWATFPAYGQLTPTQQSNLLKHDAEFLDWQIIESPIKKVLFNGASVHKTISDSRNFYLQKIGEIKYTSGGHSRTSDLITGDGPMGASVFGWTVNIQALKVTNDERADVMAKIANWLKENGV